MDLKGIPRDLTCTEVGQKWNVPSKYHAAKAFKFEDLLFEKAEERKKRKRPLVTGDRETFCATPPFAAKTTSEELQDLVMNFRLAGKASLFWESLESNDFKVFERYEKSSTKKFNAQPPKNVQQNIAEINVDIGDIIQNVGLPLMMPNRFACKQFSRIL